MRILIIGGTRFIGPHVARNLIDKGHNVTLFHRGQSHADLCSGVPCIHGDRNDFASHMESFRDLAPEVVVDMIPYGEQNATAVMRTFAGIARRVVGISSQDVYLAYDLFRGVEDGKPNPSQLAEVAPLRWSLYPYRAQAKGPEDSAYHYEKILAEIAFQSDQELPGSVLRLPCVYGPGDYQHRTFEHLKRMDDGRKAILLGEGRANWRWTRGYVEDVAAAIALVVMDERAASKTYNVGEEKAFTERQWVEAIGRAAGWHGKVVCVPDDELPTHLRSGGHWKHNLHASTARIREKLGFRESVPRDEALAKTIAWEREHPPGEVNASLFDYASEDATLDVIGRAP